MLLSGSATGTAWEARMAALVVASIAALVAAGRAALLGLVTFAAAVALATLAWTGHGAMDEGAVGWVHLGADILHLLAGGAWAGALLGLVLLVARPVGRVDAAHLTLTHRALHGFGLVGTILVGTIVVDPKGAPDGGPLVGFHGPAEEAVVTALLDGTGNGGTPVKFLKCDEQLKCLKVTEQQLQIAVGLRTKIKGMIDSINSKIRTDSALDVAEQQLLNMTSLPLYKMLAVQAMAHQSFNPGETSALAEIVAINLLSAMIDNMLDRISQSSVQVQSGDVDVSKAWREQLAAARERYAQRDFKLKDTLNQTIFLINKSVMLESTLQNSMSPAMAASLNFSRGLSAQGLN